MGTFWQTVKKYAPWQLLRKVQARFFARCSPACENTDCACPSGDIVTLQLGELHVYVRRQKPVEVPHEITIVVPRVEIKRQYARPDGCAGEEELIYNSVTVVHAPRHPGEGGQPLLPEMDGDGKGEGDICPTVTRTAIKRK